MQIPKKTKIMGLAKLVNAALVLKSGIPINNASSGTKIAVAVTWIASVSHKIPMNESSAKPLFAKGSNGKKHTAHKR